MKRRIGTAPSNGRDETARLAWWFVLVLVLAGLQYSARFGGGSAGPKDPLFRWDTFAGTIGQEIVLGLLVFAIAGFRLGWFALRGPRSSGEAAGLAIAAIAVVLVFESVYDRIVQPGNEQGLTSSWEPHHAAAYVANGILICTVVPFVEELTFRGLGFALLERFDTRTAIVVTGLMFGLSHGLVLELPIIVVFGWVLATIRARTGSVFPGMVVHALFNLVALVAAVTL